MAKLWIVVGDATSHGGTVITGSVSTNVDGKPVARVGDKVACPKCGPNAIVSGDATISIDGQSVARHGDMTACGSQLIAGKQMRAFIDAGSSHGAGSGAGKGSSALAAASAVAAAATAASGLMKKPFDEQFRAVDASSGQPMAGLPYRIELEGGGVVTGVTDSEGKTLRIATDDPQAIKLFWNFVDQDTDDIDDGDTDTSTEGEC